MRTAPGRTLPSGRRILTALGATLLLAAVGVVAVMGTVVTATVLAMAMPRPYWTEWGVRRRRK
jgi:Flp pilus assembly protein TadB